MTPGQRRHRQLKAKAQAYDDLMANLNPEKLAPGDKVGVMGRGSRMHEVLDVAPNGMVLVAYKGHNNPDRDITFNWVPAVACKVDFAWDRYEWVRRDGKTGVITPGEYWLRKDQPKPKGDELVF